jgi:WD40 repeat protein
VITLSMSPNAEYVIVGTSVFPDAYGRLMLWNIEYNPKRITISEGESIYTAIFSPDNSLIAYASRGGIYMWDMIKQQNIMSFSPKYIIPTLHFDQQNRLAFVDESKVWLVSPAGAIEYLTKDDYDELSNGSPDRRFIISWRDRYPIYVQDTEKNEVILLTEADIEEADNNIDYVAFHPTEPLLISWGFHSLGRNTSLKVWDISNKTLLKELNIGNYCLGIQFSPDGKFIVVDGQEIQIWGIPDK